MDPDAWLSRLFLRIITMVRTSGAGLHPGVATSHLRGTQAEPAPGSSRLSPQTGPPGTGHSTGWLPGEAKKDSQEHGWGVGHPWDMPKRRILGSTEVPTEGYRMSREPRYVHVISRRDSQSSESHDPVSALLSTPPNSGELRLAPMGHSYGNLNGHDYHHLAGTPEDPRHPQASQKGSSNIPAGRSLSAVSSRMNRATGQPLGADSSKAPCSF